MRLFAGINVPQGALDAIGRACEPLREAMGVRVLLPENWHITLKFLGDVPGGRVQEIHSALSKVRFAPFSVSLSGAGAFPNNDYPRAIWIGGESRGAEELAAKIEGALSFFQPGREKFRPHVTVARSRGAGDVAEFVARTKEVCSFEVSSFQLCESHLLPHGASYEVLREYEAQEG